MHRLPKIFGHNSDRRKTRTDSGSSSGAPRPRPRLKRLNAVKNFDYDYSPDSTPASTSSSYYLSEESQRTRSLDLYEGKTSFRVDGVDGEIEIICRDLGFSGIEDLGILPEEYEAMKVRTSSAPVLFSSQKLEPSFDHERLGYNDNAVDSSGDNDATGVVDIFNGRAEDDEGYVRTFNHAFGSCNDISKKFGENLDFSPSSGFHGSSKPNIFRRSLGDDLRVSDRVVSSDNTKRRLDEHRGNGIKGARPPVLAPPPLLSLPAIEKECSTWDLVRAFAPDNDSSISRFGLLEDEEGAERGDLKRVMTMPENRLLLESCSFTTSSNDDDSSSTTTEPMYSISPSGGMKRVIVDWQKGELLGRGSFGSVYEGIADDGFFFAVKEVSLLDQGDEGKQRVSQLEQEIALLSQFEHENIVQYYGTKKDESHLYIFLELVTKGSLLSLYQKYALRDSQVSAYTRQILHGLKYLHDRNVVHRDIKCANILVDTNGLVKLADFGLAKATKLNDVKSCKGTAFWMAPEVVRSQGYGLAADIWSLGCTVLEMLTRRFPYSNLECMAALFRIGRGERPPIPDSLSNDARDFMLECLQADPNLRPTAAQLLDHPFVKKPLLSSSSATSPFDIHV